MDFVNGPIISGATMRLRCWPLSLEASRMKEVFQEGQEGLHNGCMQNTLIKQISHSTGSSNYGTYLVNLLMHACAPEVLYQC